MKEHYLIQQHQEVIIKIVRQVISQLHDSQMDIEPARTTTVSDPATAQVQELYETINILPGGTTALSDDGQRLSNDSLINQIKIQALTEAVSHAQMSVKESHGFLQGLKHNQDILNQELTLLKQTIDDMQYVSYDGTFVWRITNFQAKMSK
jgi:hypothetical protein